MSNIDTETLLTEYGLEPVIQMTCRDRNRLAIQADHSRPFRSRMSIVERSPLGRKSKRCESTGWFSLRARLEIKPRRLKERGERGFIFPLT
jgi:hypothetical protein